MSSDKPLWGDGTLEFGRWETPFENTQVWLLEITWGFGPWWPEKSRPLWSSRSLHKSPCDAELVVLVSVDDPDRIEVDYAHDPLYRVSFQDVSAFRVLDEGGLPEFGGLDDAQGRIRAVTTFRSRNNAWSKQSPAVVLRADEGWWYVIVTPSDCIEVVSGGPPQVTLEPS